MSALMDIFEPGDRFATVDRRGRVLVWQVNEAGLAHVMPGQYLPGVDPFDDEGDPTVPHTFEGDQRK